MALVTVEDVENVTGAEFTDAATNLCAYLIDRVTSYIETITQVTFAPVTGYTFRGKSDVNGEMEFPVYPVTDISNFHDFVTDTDIDYPRWDGLALIYGLFPNQVVDVTIDYGMEDAPLDIKSVAIEAVRRGMAVNATSLKTKTVGDVTYVFGDMLTFPPADQAILDNYTPHIGTITLGDNRGRPGPNGVLQMWLPWANGPDWDYYCD